MGIICDFGNSRLKRKLIIIANIVSLKKRKFFAKICPKKVKVKKWVQNFEFVVILNGSLSRKDKIF